MNKLTDNEIIKALELCANWESDKSCDDCPANTYGFGCANRMAKHSLGLINRQKAEIERYKGVIKILENDVKIANIEAVKKFAKFLINQSKPIEGMDIPDYVVGF